MILESVLHRLQLQEGDEPEESFVSSLYKMDGKDAKDWRGVNLTRGGNANRPNLIRECFSLKDDKDKINCLRKLKETAAMNPIYQTRIDRFIDAITDTYEPTKEPGLLSDSKFQ